MTPAPLTQAQLAELKRALRNRWTLSCYITIDAATPAELMRDWDDIAAGFLPAIPSGTDVSSGLRHAIAAVQGELLRLYRVGVRGGAAIFAGSTGFRLSTTLPAVVARRARWQRGIWAAPYVCALAERRSVIVILVGDRQVRVCHALGGDLIELGAEPVDPAPVASASARDRLARRIVHRLNALLTHADGVLLGGSPDTISAIRNALGPDVVTRTGTMSGLSVAASTAAIGEAVACHAAALRDATDLALVDQFRMLGGPYGNSVAGMADSLGELRLHQVAMLLTSSRCIAEHPIEAEDAIELALDQGASVAILSGTAAARFDILAGGIGAVLARPAASPPSATTRAPTSLQITEPYLVPRERMTLTRLSPEAGIALVAV